MNCNEKMCIRDRLLTDDGDLANKLMHPKYRIFKTYEAEIEGGISEDSINKLRNGVLIDGYKTAPAKVKLLKKTQKNSFVQISIHEGKNRQVRKMFETVSYTHLFLLQQMNS